MAYGIIGILYAGMIANLRDTVRATSPELSVALVEDEAFRLSIFYFPWYLVVILLLITAICLLHFRLRRSSEYN